MLLIPTVAIIERVILQAIGVILAAIVTIVSTVTSSLIIGDHAVFSATYCNWHSQAWLVILLSNSAISAIAAWLRFGMAAWHRSQYLTQLTQSQESSLRLRFRGLKLSVNRCCSYLNEWQSMASLATA